MGSSSDDLSHGLIGKLWYDENEFGWLDDFDDYVAKGVPVATPVYTDDLDVPTRRFTEGFQLTDGNVVKDDSGKAVAANFALQFRGEIRLSSNQRPGRYQFATLSGDGSIVRIGKTQDGDDDGDWDGDDLHVVVDNDGIHATRMGCADHGVRFGRGTRRRIEVDYFHGSHEKLALVLLWRRMDDGDYCPWDSACGREGDELFFDPSQSPSVPQPAWIGLLARGWRVVGSESLSLPPEVPGNPCVGPSPGPSPSPSPSVTSPVPPPSPSVTPPAPSPHPSPTPSPSVTPPSGPSPSPWPPLPS